MNLSFTARQRALAPSGDPVTYASPPQPLTIGQVAVGTALGSALFWGGLVAVGAAVGALEGGPRMRVNPFAGFDSFDQCERSARAKGVRDAGAYCGAIERRTRGER